MQTPKLRKALGRLRTLGIFKPRTQLQRIVEVISVVGLVFMFSITIGIFFPGLPATFPVLMQCVRNAVFPYAFVLLFFSLIWAPIWMYSEKIFSKFTDRIDVWKGKMVLSPPVGLPSSTIVLTLALASSIFMFSYRYTDALVPRGWDTPWYMAILNLMLKYDYGVVFSIDRPFFFLVIDLFQRISGISTDTIMIAAPIFLGTFYVLSVYYLVKAGTDNKLLAAISSLFTLVSIYTLRISHDLHTNLFALPLMLIFFAFFLKSLNKPHGKKDILIASVLFAMIAFTHLWVWVTTSLVLFIFFLVDVIDGGKKSLKKLLLLAEVSLPGVVSMMLYLLYGPSRTYLLGAHVILASDINPSIPSTDFLYTSFIRGAMFPEHVVLTVAAIFGVLVLASRKHDSFSKLMMSWLFAASILTFLYLYSPRLGFRTLFQYPIPILAAFGMYFLVDLFSRVLGSHKPRESNSLFKTALLLATFLLLFNASLPFAYANYHAPSKEALEQLYWIRDNYDPKKIIVVIDDGAAILRDDRMHWALAIIGPNVYFGRLPKLMAGLPDLIERRSEWSGENTFENIAVMSAFTQLRREALSNISRYTILLPSALYEVKPAEKVIADKIPGEDIYVVKNLDSNKIKEWASILEKVGPPGFLLSDDFDADTIALGIWSRGFFRDGTSSVANGVLNMTLAGGGIGVGTGEGILSSDVFSRPLTIEAKFKAQNLPTEDFSIQFRYHGFSFGTAFELEYQLHSAHRHWHIRKFKGTVITDVTYPWAIDIEWHVLKMVVEESKVSVWLDGVLINEMLDFQMSEPRHAVTFYLHSVAPLGSYLTVLWDYIRIY